MRFALFDLHNCENCCIFAPDLEEYFKQPEISEHYQTFYIDLLHTSSICEFAYTFGKTVLPTFTLEMGKIQSPEYTIQEVMGWLEESETPCIVCFDEFQRINKYPDNKQGQVEAMLRGIIHQKACTGINQFHAICHQKTHRDGTHIYA